ncbi:hypothetical protein ACV2ZE_25955, partial [Escherichia coli]
MNEPGAALTPARRYGVDGRTVAVFDGLLPEVGQHVEALARAPFTRTEVARPETAQYKHWVNEIRLEVLTRQPILQTTL